MLETPASESLGVLSPDGRWLAYETDKDSTNLPAIYVRSCPAGNNEVRISMELGHAPQWSGDGQRLFYWTGAQQIVEVDVTVSNGVVQPGEPRELFVQPPGPGPDPLDNLSLDPVGPRFLLPVRSANQGPVPLTAVLNWVSTVHRQSAIGNRQSAIGNR